MVPFQYNNFSLLKLFSSGSQQGYLSGTHCSCRQFCCTLHRHFLWQTRNYGNCGAVVLVCSKYVHVPLDCIVLSMTFVCMHRYDICSQKDNIANWSKKLLFALRWWAPSRQLSRSASRLALAAMWGCDIGTFSNPTVRSHLQDGFH